MDGLGISQSYKNVYIVCIVIISRVHVHWRPGSPLINLNGNKNVQRSGVSPNQTRDML